MQWKDYNSGAISIDQWNNFLKGTVVESMSWEISPINYNMGSIEKHVISSIYFSRVNITKTRSWGLNSRSKWWHHCRGWRSDSKGLISLHILKKGCVSNFSPITWKILGGGNMTSQRVFHVCLSNQISPFYEKSRHIDLCSQKWLCPKQPSHMMLSLKSLGSRTSS